MAWPPDSRAQQQRHSNNNSNNDLSTSAGGSLRQRLDEMDKRILEAIIYKFDGGPVGLSSLAVAVGEDSSTIEEVYEPYLVMQGMLTRTPRGRVAMKRSYEKLGIPAPNHVSGTDPELSLDS